MQDDQDLRESGDADDPAPVRSIVQPADDVWAMVRRGERPSDPPPELVAFAVEVEDDWALTDDVIAFGRDDLVTRFLDWRAGWMLTRSLTTVSNLERLVLLAGDDPPELLGEAVRALAAGRGNADVPFALAGSLADEVDRLRGLVAESEAVGYGIVDRTPGANRAGLVRSWPSVGEPEVVAARGLVSVELRPGVGLSVRIGGDDPTVIEPVVEARLLEDGWHVGDGTREAELHRTEARPIAWLAPGSTQWAVREVPLGLVWASTFAGLDVCVTAAVTHRRAIRLTTRRPIVPV